MKPASSLDGRPPVFGLVAVRECPLRTCICCVAVTLRRRFTEPHPSLTPSVASNAPLWMCVESAANSFVLPPIDDCSSVVADRSVDSRRKNARPEVAKLKLVGFSFLRTRAQDVDRSVVGDKFRPVANTRREFGIWTQPAFYRERRSLLSVMRSRNCHVSGHRPRGLDQFRGCRRRWDEKPQHKDDTPNSTTVFSVWTVITHANGDAAAATARDTRRLNARKLQKHRDVSCSAGLCRNTKAKRRRNGVDEGACRATPGLIRSLSGLARDLDVNSRRLHKLTLLLLNWPTIFRILRGLLRLRPKHRRQPRPTQDFEPTVGDFRGCPSLPLHRTSSGKTV